MKQDHSHGLSNYWRAGLELVGPEIKACLSFVPHSLFAGLSVDCVLYLIPRVEVPFFAFTILLGGGWLSCMLFLFVTGIPQMIRTLARLRHLIKTDFRVEGYVTLAHDDGASLVVYKGRTTGERNGFIFFEIESPLEPDLGNHLILDTDTMKPFPEALGPLRKGFAVVRGREQMMPETVDWCVSKNPRVTTGRLTLERPQLPKARSSTRLFSGKTKGL